MNPDDVRKEPLDPNALYRVRDGKGSDETKPCVVWGENLTLAEALSLKETVVGSEKSRTARLEPMGTASPSLVTAATPPSSDPELAEAMSRALAAARGPAMAAQARVDAARQPSAPIDLAAVMPDVEQVADIDLELGDGDEGEIPEDAGDQAEIDAQLAEYEAKGRALYEASLGSQPGYRPWEELGAGERAAFCFQAVNGQIGPVTDVP